MAKPLRPKRGTTAKNDAFVGLASEITIDTEKHSIRVHDGVTAGGHALATDADLATVRATANEAKTNADIAQTTADTAKTSAEAAQASADACLPLSGGTMTGTIKTTQGLALAQDTTSNYTGVYGGTAHNTGAYLGLYGKDNTSAGMFTLASSDGTTTNRLQGHLNGKLTWCGKDIICVESWRSGDNWYRKYSDGWIEQGGLITVTGASRTCNLNIAMTTTNYTVVTTYQGNDGADYSIIVKERSTTAFTTVGGQGGSNNRYILYYACGY